MPPPRSRCRRDWRNLPARGSGRARGAAFFFNLGLTSMRSVGCPPSSGTCSWTKQPCARMGQIRSFLHGADVGAAFAQLLDSEVQGPVNIGADERIALAELIERIALEIGRPDLVRLGARSAPADEPALLVPDVHRLPDEVQLRPRDSLGGGISDTIALG